MFQGLSLYLIKVCGQRERGRQGGKGKMGRIGDSKKKDMQNSEEVEDK